MIEDKFRLELFRKAIEKEGMIKKFDKKTRMWPGLYKVNENRSNKVYKMANTQKINCDYRNFRRRIRKALVAIKDGMSGKVTEVKLPIIESPELALLVAKGMGMEV